MGGPARGRENQTLGLIAHLSSEAGRAVEIRPYTQDLEPLVRAFNQRLRAGGEQNWAFPESHIPRFPRTANTNPYQELFLTFDHGEVRGGYMLTHSLFAVQGQIVRIACGPQLNTSEAIVDLSYGLTGALNVRDAMRKQPLLYGLGMGGFEERQAKLLASMKWPMRAVPFFFKVIRPARFFANITYLRRKQRNRILLNLARYTGIGWAGLRIAQFRPGARNGWDEIKTCYSFGLWADEIWSKCKDKYALIAVRDSATLNTIYPSSDPRFLRLLVSRSGENVGWAVMLDTQMSGHKHFGNMRVGSIVDCLAEPLMAGLVVRRATSLLEQRGVDLIVSNQANAAWGKALLAAGYLAGPSNFILALSPMLAARFPPIEAAQEDIHMNRGDGDGPIHL
jgi:hypothetical protein